MAARPTRVIALALAMLVVVTIVGWVGARQIRSPAQVAADTAPPKASPITIPVVRRTLSAKVIVRGTVRYGAPQAGRARDLADQAGREAATSSPARPAPRAELGAGDRSR